MTKKTKIKKEFKIHCLEYILELLNRREDYLITKLLKSLETL